MRWAIGFLSANINPSIRLANGTQVRYHSLYYSDKKEMRKLRSLMKSTPFGNVITMDTPPDAIVVAVDDEEIKKNWAYPTLKEGEVLIPVVLSSCNEQKLWIRGGKGFDQSKVVVKSSHAVEMAFAVTFHKAQGRTLRRVILALSKRPGGLAALLHSSLFVALSKVRHGDHIWILCNKNDDLSYLTLLECSNELLAWFKGFGDSQPALWFPKRLSGCITISCRGEKANEEKKGKSRGVA